MAETEPIYQDTDSVVCVARIALDISTPTEELTDEEIRRICKWIGERAPDTITIDNKKMLGRMGIDAMLFIALTEFPEFYERYELAQFN